MEERLKEKFENTKLLLYTPTKVLLEILNDIEGLGAYSIVKTMKTNEPWEVSFKISSAYAIEAKNIPLPNGNTVRCGITQDSCGNLIRIAGETDFYIIKRVSVSSTDSSATTLEVKCEREETSLQKLFCEPLKLIAQTPQALWEGIKTSCKACTLNYVWEGTDADLPRRSLVTEDEQTVWDNLLSLAKIYNGWWEIRNEIGDNLNQINTDIKHLFLRTKPIQKGMYVKTGRDIKDLSIDFDSSDLITRVYGYGSRNLIDDRDINIMGVNPSGKPYVENFGYFKFVLGMTDLEIQNNVNCHQEATYRNTDISEAQDLYNSTVEELNRRCIPKITGNITYSDLFVFDDALGSDEVEWDLHIGEQIKVINTDVNYIFDTQITSITKTYDGNPIPTPLEISNNVTYGYTSYNDIMNSLQKVNRTVDVGTTGEPYVSDTTVKDVNGESVKTKIGKVKATLEVHEDKINAVVSSDSSGMSWELNQDAFKVACVGASGASVTIDKEGQTIDDGKFRIRKNGDTVFKVNTSGVCNAVGGFVVEDGDTSCEIGSEGITLTGENEHTAKIGIIDDGKYSGTLIKDDLYVEDVLRVFGKAKFEKGVDFLEDDITIDGVSLKDYILKIAKG